MTTMSIDAMLFLGFTIVVVCVILLVKNKRKIREALRTDDWAVSDPLGFADIDRDIPDNGFTIQSGQPHYIGRKPPLRFRPGKKYVIRARFLMLGEVLPIEPQYPPCVSIYFQRKGDTWQGNKDPYVQYRWYARDVVEWQDGYETTLEIPLEYENFHAVYGDRGTEIGFVEAVEQMGRIGFTFGTLGGRGHGLWFSDAKFICKYFIIEETN